MDVVGAVYLSTRDHKNHKIMDSLHPEILGDYTIPDVSPCAYDHPKGEATYGVCAFA